MNTGGENLIEELLANPVRFRERGRGYDLLQQYFAGLPLGTLAALLRHQELDVRRAAVWIASELGRETCSLIDDIILLLNDEDRFLSYHVLDVLIVCSAERGELIHIAHALQDTDEVIRRRAMALLVRASESQISAALLLAREKDDPDHQEGLELLLRCRSIPSDQFATLLHLPKDLLRKYAAIAAKRQEANRPHIREELSASQDPDIRYLTENAV